MDISTRETTLKKVRGNKVDFSTIEMTSKKVHAQQTFQRRIHVVFGLI